MATLILHEAVRMKKLLIGIAQLSMRSSLGDAACWQVPWIARIPLDACLTVSIITYHCYALYFPSCNTQQSAGFDWSGTFNIFTLALICPSGPTTCRTFSKQNTWPHFSAWAFWSHALPAVFPPRFCIWKIMVGGFPHCNCIGYSILFLFGPFGPYLWLRIPSFSSLWVLLHHILSKTSQNSMGHSCLTASQDSLVG